MKNAKRIRLNDYLKYLAIAGPAFLVSCDARDYSSNDLDSLSESDEENDESVGEPQRHSNFRFPDEKYTIIYHSRRVGVDEDLMLSIREAENGSSGRQFGIMPNARYNNDRGFNQDGEFHQYPDDGQLSKQVSWSAWTVRKNKEKYDSLSDDEKARYGDFIDYLGEKYSPAGADNDPEGLNRNWKRNVRNRYSVHKGN